MAITAIAYYGAVGAPANGNWNTVGNWYSFPGTDTKFSPLPPISLGRLPDPSTELVVLYSGNVTTGPSSPYSGMIHTGNNTATGKVSAGSFTGPVLAQSEISGGSFSNLFLGQNVIMRSTDGAGTYSFELPSSIALYNYRMNFVRNTNYVVASFYEVYYNGSSDYYYTVCVSSDGGATWARKYTFNVTGTYDISMSSDARYIALGGSGVVYVSNDYGVTFTTKSLEGVKPNSTLAVSSSGQYMTCVLTSTAHIYTSSDYGVTWTQRTAISTILGKMSMSTSGQYQIVSKGYSGKILVSTDYGVTWTTRGPSTYVCFTTSMSDDGSVMFLATLSNGLYKSTDYGTNWTAIAAINSIQFMDCSSNGSIVYISDGVDIRKSTDTGSTFSMIFPYTTSVLTTSPNGSTLLLGNCFPSVSTNPLLSGGTFSGSFKYSQANYNALISNLPVIAGGTITGQFITNLGTTYVRVTGGTYSPAVTLTYTPSPQGITGFVSDPGFAKGGGTFSPQYTYVGFPDILGAGLL